MTRDDILRMAREVGLPLDLIIHDNFDEINWQRIERFAALVAAAEREACARVVEQYCGAWDDQGYALTAAIRARGVNG